MSAEGRCARTQFWIGVAVLFSVLAVYEAVSGPTLRLLTFWFVYPALLGVGVLRALQAASRSRPVRLVGGAGALRMAV